LTYPYRGICELKVCPSPKKKKNSTVVNLDITWHAVKTISGKTPTDTTIWHSIHNKDIRRNICVCLWKTLPKTQKCGEYLVLHTWSSVLKNEASLPEKWIKQPRVLVGIVPLEQP